MIVCSDVIIIVGLVVVVVVVGVVIITVVPLVVVVVNGALTVVPLVVVVVNGAKIDVPEVVVVVLVIMVVPEVVVVRWGATWIRGQLERSGSLLLDDRIGCVPGGTTSASVIGPPRDVAVVDGLRVRGGCAD